MVFRRSGTVEKLGDVGGSLPRFGLVETCSCRRWRADELWRWKLYFDCMERAVVTWEVNECACVDE
jgi:hypothetical protein